MGADKKEFSIELTTPNVERNAAKAAAALGAIVKKIRAVTEASASFNIKTKLLEGRLRGVAAEGQKFAAVFKQTKDSIRLTGIAVSDTTKKLALLRAEQSKAAKFAAANARLKDAVGGGARLEALKKERDLQIKLANIERARAESAKRLIIDPARLIRLRAEEEIQRKIRSIELARQISQKKLIDDPRRIAKLKEEQALINKIRNIERHRILSSERLIGANKKVQKSLKEMHISWTSLVRLLSAQVLYRAVFGLFTQLGEAFTRAVELKIAIAEIQTIAPDSDTFRAFNKVLREVSDAFGVDIIEQTEAAYQAYSNQVVNTAEELKEFLIVSNQLAIATRSTTAEAVNLLTGVLNAYRLSVSSATEVSAKFFKLIELGRVRADEMANSLGNIAILANQVGISLDELLGLIATLTVQGIKFSEAQTQIRGIMIKLIKPTQAMIKFINQLGFESGEAAIKGLGLLRFFELLFESTGDSTTEIAKLINRVRGLSGVLAITGKGFGLLQRNINEISEDAMPAFNRAITLVIENQGKRFDIFRNKLKNFFTQDLGVEFLEGLDAITGGFDRLLVAIKFFANAIVTVIAPAIVVMIGTVAVGLKSLFVATGPFGPALAALGILLTIITASVRNFKDETARLKDGLDKMANAAERAAEIIERTLGDALEAVAIKLSETVGNIASGLAANISEQLTAIRATFDQIIDIYTGLDEALARSLETASDSISDLVDGFADDIERIRDLIEQISDEFIDVAERFAKDAFKLEFESAEPAEKIKLLTDQITDLQAALAGVSTIDAFEKLTKKIESSIKKLNKTQRRQLDEDARKATKRLSDFTAASKKEAAIRKRLADELKKEGTISRSGRTSSGGPNKNTVARLKRDLIEAISLAEKLKGFVEASSIGGDPLQAATAEGIRRTLIDAAKQLNADTTAALAAQLTSSQAQLNVLLQAQTIVLKTAQINEQIAQDQQDRFDELETFLESINKKKIEDLFGLEDIKEAARQVDFILGKLDQFKALQNALKLDTSETDTKIASFEKAEELIKSESELRDQTKDLTDSVKSLDASIVATKIDIAEGKEALQSLAKALASIIALGETKETGRINLLGKVGDKGPAIKDAANQILRNIVEESGISRKAIAELAINLEAAGKDFRIFQSDDTRQALITAIQKVLQSADIADRRDLTDIVKSESLTDNEKTAATAVAKGIEDLRTVMNSLNEIQRGSGETMQEIFDQTRAQTEVLENLEDRFARTLEELENRGIIIQRTFEEDIVDFTTAVANFDTAVNKIVKAVSGSDVTTEHAGGLILGQGHGDTVNARLTPGEFVVNKRNTGKFMSQLIGINRGTAPSGTASGSIEVGGINIEIKESKTPQATAKAVAAELNRGIRVGTIQLRR